MLIVYKNLQKYKLYQTNQGLYMNKSLKFKQFLADIKQVNPLLVESVIEAYHAVYESSEEIVDRTKQELDNLGGSVPTEELTGLQKLPMRKQESIPIANTLYDRYNNFKRYGKDTSNITDPKKLYKERTRSPMVEFIASELDDPRLANMLGNVLRMSANDRPSVHKEVTTAFNNFINQQIDIENFSDIVENAYNQLEATPEEDTNEYKTSLTSTDTLDTVGGVLDPTQGSDSDVDDFFKTWKD